MSSLLERYHDKIRGVISCYDRVIIKGTLPGFCYSAGMTSYLYSQKIRVFDYVKWAEPLREQIRANAEKIAEENVFTTTSISSIPSLDCVFYVSPPGRHLK